MERLVTKGSIKQGLIEMGVQPTMADLFLAYHSKRPQVWQQFEKTALFLLTTRAENFGAKEIFEALRRGNDEIPVAAGEEFKLDNNYTAIYARVFVLFHPEFRHRIELRRTQSSLRMAA